MRSETKIFNLDFDEFGNNLPLKKFPAILISCGEMAGTMDFKNNQNPGTFLYRIKFWNPSQEILEPFQFF